MKRPILAFVCIVLFVCPSWAANLTNAQLDTLKSWLTANGGGMTDEQILAALNADANPNYWAWKSFVQDSAIYETTTPAPDNTSWSWTIYIARSQGERDAWRQMVTQAGGIKPYLSNVRTGIADIFSGAPGADQRTHLLAISRRKLTVGEKLFSVVATGPGNTGGNRGATTDPDALGVGADGKLVEGLITDANITAARNRP